MADLSSGAAALAWKDGNAVANAVALAWKDGTAISSIGSTYTYPGAPVGSTPSTPGSLVPVRDITAATAYVQQTVLAAKDLRDDAALPVVTVSLDLPDGSDLWTLQASGPAALADALLAGEQPATIEVTIGTDAWRFVVEEVDQPLSFGSSGVTVRGRSLAAVAGAPFQVQQVWLVDAPTSPAQVCALANTTTGVEVEWRLTDWALPAGAWSASADPLAVVRTMAAAAGAVVECDRTQYRLRVTPRYPIAPNLWATSTPDVQIAWAAVEQARTARADQPDYDSVLVAGQQSGGTLLARLEGTAGGKQAPMITDALLTDTSAMLERATAVLYAFGGRTRETRTLQIHGAVVPRGALVRCVEPTATWVGMVRAVSVQATLERARQTLVMERPTSFPAGSVAPEPLADPYFASVSLLVSGDGAAGATGIVDRGPLGVEFTRVGNAVLSATTPKFGATSMYLPDTGAGWIAPNNAGMQFGLGDFTIEFWLKAAAGSPGGEFMLLSCRDSSGSNRWAVGFGSSRFIAFNVDSSGDSAAPAVPTDTWVHIAICRQDTTLRFFHNGALTYSVANSANLNNSSSSLRIGTEPTFSGFVPAYLADIRITKGVARYSASFQPPTEAYAGHE